jgi:putative peptide zinc metalloprotease protein
VTQSDVARVREETRSVEARLFARPGETLSGRILSDITGGTDRLPSEALGSRGGGRIPVDARDGEGTRSLERVFAVNVALPERARPYPIGARVLVRFVHGREPLARQWYRGIRQMLLARFRI